MIQEFILLGLGIFVILSAITLISVAILCWIERIWEDIKEDGLTTHNVIHAWIAMLLISMLVYQVFDFIYSLEV